MCHSLAFDTLGLRKRESESLNGCSLIFLPFFQPSAKTILLLPIIVYYRGTTRDHVIECLSLESVLQRCPGGALPPRLKASVPVVHTLTRGHLWEVLEEALLGSLKAPAL